MYARLVVALLVLLLVPQTASAQYGAVRHRPGAVTLRGTCDQVEKTGFTLHTKTRGTILVQLRPQTAISMTKSGKRVSLANGDHVGVHGLLAGNRMVAITVRVYPTKAKSITVRGTVTTAGAGHVVVRAGGSTKTIQMTRGTAMLGAGGAPKPGREVRVRVVVSGKALVATSIYVDKPAVHGEHLQVRGTVVGMATGKLTVRAGSSTVPVRTTSATTTLHGRVRVGESVTVYACCQGQPLVATSIHVQQSHPPARHVRISGIVLAAAPGSVSVHANGRPIHVSVPSTARIYPGTRPGKSADIRPGAQVLVYACCAGTALTASAIHVRTVQAAVVTVPVRGTVSSVSATSIRVKTSSGTVVVTRSHSTSYQRGSVPLAATAVQPGDLVSILAHREGRSLVAVRVHVYVVHAASIVVHGTVVSVSGNSIVVQVGGVRRTVWLQPSGVVTLNGSSFSLRSLRPGDVLSLRATPAVNGLTTGRIRATRTIPRVITIRGALISAHGHDFVLQSPTRGRLVVHSATPATVDGSPAPQVALFPGAPVEVRGSVIHGAVRATAIVVQVQARSISGRVRALGRDTLDLGTATHTSHIIVGPGCTLRDGAHAVRWTAVHLGAFLRVSGYLSGTGSLHAGNAVVQHPALDVSGVLSGAEQTLKLVSSSDQYLLHFGTGTSIMTERGSLSLQASDLAAGMRVHVTGRAESDGSLRVATLAVRLTSTTVRARIASLSQGGMMLATSAGSLPVRVNGAVTVTQGSRTLALSDLVAGDDVSVQGYRTATTLIAQSIAVHRRLTGIDGTVTAIASPDISLQTATGVIHVVLAQDTAYTGGQPSDLAAGLRVHVTGYIRGDGVLLATRVRLMKPARPVASPKPGAPRRP